MMFGEIGGWFFKGLGSIKPDEHQPGFKNVLLSPNFVTGLTHFEASHKGPYGTIVSSWKRTGNSISYTVTIPANSTATLHLPLSLATGKANAGKFYQLKAGTHHFDIQ
jgi:alpha-L-rhamnosidase